MSDTPVTIIGLLIFGLVYIELGEGLSGLGLSLLLAAALAETAILVGRSPQGQGLLWSRLRRAMPAAPPSPVAASREPIPAGLRFAVLRRDGFRCAYCGRGESDGVKLHIDHLVPVARAGPTTLENLVTACQDCNLGKSASDLIGGA